MQTPTTPSSDKIKVNVVTGQGGGGHYATYHALCAVAEQQQFPWEFSVTDMDEIITNLAAQNQIQNAYEMFGISGHDLYNLMLKSGWTWLWPLKMWLNKFMVKLNHEVGVNFFEQHWRKQQPDLVVSVMPLYNKGLAASLQKAKPGTPYITLIVDFADYPPAFWLEPDADCLHVCATEKAIAQAATLGVKPERVIKSSGMVVHPRFYQPLTDDRSQSRERLGLDPERLTGIVMFGGHGSKVMLEIAQKLEALGDQLQLIFLCGRNETLATEIKNIPGNQRRFVTTFTEDVPFYMHLSDFFIGKPGPGSLSEALVMKLPVITESNGSTLIHERYNAEWIKEQQVGVVLSNFRQIDRAVKQFLDPETFARYCANVQGIDNQAVFEVSEIMAQAIAQINPTKTTLVSKGN